MSCRMIRFAQDVIAKMAQKFRLTRTDRLIRWFWNQSDTLFPGIRKEDGICQCGTERLIDPSANPNQMRTVLMVSVFIDQMVYTHFRGEYAHFRDRFHFPKLFSHANFVGMANPSWLVYSYHGYDEKMDWEAAHPVAVHLFSDCLRYIASMDGDQDNVQEFLKIAETEVHLEFEPKAAQELLAILSGLGITDN